MLVRVGLRRSFPLSERLSGFLKVSLSLSGALMYDASRSI